MKSNSRLTILNAFIIILLYLAVEILLNILVRIFFGTDVSPETKRVIDGVIGRGMIVNIIVSVLIILTTVFIFRKDTKDIYFEREKFSLSKLYYFFPLIWFSLGAFALLTTDLSVYKFSTILLVIIATLSIAINEEIVTRGILLTALRKKGISEWLVLLITTLVFASLHIVNVLGGNSFTQLLVVVFSGVLLYITRRVFNNLFVPILLHAFFDAAIFLQIGNYLENQTLSDNILDFNLASFLITVLATLLFLIFGRKLLKKDTSMQETSL